MQAWTRLSLYGVVPSRLAEIRYLVKEFRPFFYNLFITSLDNSENVLQNMRVDMRIIMSQEAFPGLRNPNFEGVPSDT